MGTQLPRAECLSFDDCSGFYPELLLWGIPGVHDNWIQGDRAVIFN